MLYVDSLLQVYMNDITKSSILLYCIAYFTCKWLYKVIIYFTDFFYLSFTIKRHKKGLKYIYHNILSSLIYVLYHIIITMLFKPKNTHKSQYFFHSFSTIYKRLAQGISSLYIISFLLCIKNTIFYTCNFKKKKGCNNRIVFVQPKSRVNVCYYYII